MLVIDAFIVLITRSSLQCYLFCCLLFTSLGDGIRIASISSSYPPIALPTSVPSRTWGWVCLLYWLSLGSSDLPILTLPPLQPPQAQISNKRIKRPDKRVPMLRTGWHISTSTVTPLPPDNLYLSYTTHGGPSVRDIEVEVEMGCLVNMSIYNSLYSEYSNREGASKHEMLPMTARSKGERR